MTQQGFNDYIFAVYGYKNGTAKSYITAIHIIDKIFLYDDVFDLQGESITCINDIELLKRIEVFVRAQQSLFKKGEDSIFRNISSGQNSYPGKGFCSAALEQLINYYSYEKEALKILIESPNAKSISKDLITLFKIDKEGNEATVTARIRLGQNYFRKMVLHNFGGNVV